MNSLISVKFILSILGIGTIITVAGTAINDQKFQSTSFMNDTEVQTVRTFSDYEEDDRDVASINTGDELVIPRIPLNINNSLKVDGEWEITRILIPKNTKEDEVVYDISRPLDKESIITLPIKLIATSEVRFDNDTNLEFYILTLSQSLSNPLLVTASFIRPYDNGYEIIEAKRLLKFSKLTNKKSSKLLASKMAIEEKGVKLQEDVEINMNLQKVLFPKYSSGILSSSSNNSIIDGTLSLRNESIEQLSFTLRLSELKALKGKGTNKDITVELNYINLKNGSFTFTLDEVITSGLITKNGQDGYKIRFVTGVLQGASLSFSSQEEELETDNEYTKMANQEIQEEASNSRRDSQVEGDDDVSYDRQASYDSKVSEDSEDGVEYEQLNSQSVKAVIQQSGFDFNS